MSQVKYEAEIFNNEDRNGTGIDVTVNGQNAGDLNFVITASYEGKIISQYAYPLEDMIADLQNFQAMFWNGRQERKKMSEKNRYDVVVAFKVRIEAKNIEEAKELGIIKVNDMNWGAPDMDYWFMGVEDAPAKEWWED